MKPETYRPRRSQSFLLQFLGILLASIVIGVSSSYATTIITQAKLEVRLNNVEKQNPKLITLFDKMTTLQVDIAATKVAVGRNLDEIRLVQNRMNELIKLKR